MKARKIKKYRTLSATFRAAARLLMRDGWTQGMWLNHDTGARCILGAIDAVAVNPTAARTLLLAKGRSINWNDAHGRTRAEVVKVLRDCAREVAR